MRRTVINLVVVAAGITLPSIACANTLQVTTSLQNSHFLGSVDLTHQEPAASIAVDWTLDNGGFAGVDCYISTIDNFNGPNDSGIKSGCDYYAGYFKPFNQDNAVSVQFTRHELSPGHNQRWDFNEVTANWHINRKTTFSASYSKNWLNRPFDSFEIKAGTQIPLAERIHLNLSASILAFENSAVISNLTSAKASLSYTKKRWTTEAGIILTDSDQTSLLTVLDFNQPNFSLTLTYRLY